MPHWSADNNFFCSFSDSVLVLEIGLILQLQLIKGSLLGFILGSPFIALNGDCFPLI